MNQSLDIKELLREVHGDSVEDFLVPPPSFTIMKCELVAFDKENSTLTTKIPVLESWLNPYSTMQGGMIIAAIDNALGPLSLLIAPKNMTRNIESKLSKAITMDLEYIYVTAFLAESKKRRLVFEVVVKDRDENIYATARVTNWII
ncbi:PaaI family thioesterase [Sulfurimonas sp. CS5]|jgi:acyl-coenzyme A thioesterase PaaI-like protein|uniref:PaaI family thioesterase n=1 Tax=Sulfurimonas sp. CS5 TaxID=3391145 RepID=UPI0039EBA0DC